MNAVAGNNPYIGPRPFETKDKLYGREREITELDHLLSAERVVLLYAPSGAGKSSLINAGIIPRLDWYYALTRDQPTAGRFDCWPPTRVNSPLPTNFKVKNRFAWSAAMGLEQEVPDEFRRSSETLADLSLKDAVAGRRRRNGAPEAVLLIFDQFEEFLRVDPLGVPEKEAFFDQLGELLHDPKIWALFVLREDYLAALDPYSRRLPTRLTYRYRIDHLSREEAAEAMEGPTQDTPRKFAEDVVKKLVTDLAQVQIQQPDGTFVPQTGLHVEPMHLQVVCVGLWDRMAPEDLLIDTEDVTTFGDVGQALASYYDAAVAKIAAGDAGNERRIREWFDDRLITPDGVRRQVLRGVDQSEGLPNTQIDKLQDTYLVRVEERAGAKWFELAHDRLIKPVRHSNEAWRIRNLTLFQRQAKLWAENARPDDMLFAGSELAEALRFAEGNPEGMSKTDKDFLHESKEMRDRISKEQRRVHELEEKSREIADKNKRLRTQRLWLVIVGVISIAALILSLYSNTQLEARGLYGKLKRSVAMARGGDPVHALTQLIPLAKDIASRPQGIALIDALSGLSLESELDLGLIEVLANHPPVERRLGSHDHIVRALHFSANGERLYSGGWDDLLKAWPVNGPVSAIQTREDHSANIRSLAYHGGRQLLVSTDDDGLVKLWDVRGQAPLPLSTLNTDHSAHTDEVWAAALSPDGQRLVTAGKDKRIVLWDITDPAHTKRLGELVNRFHHHGIYRLAYIENGRYAGALVSADWGGQVGIWQAPDPLSNPDREPDLGLTALGTEGSPVEIFSLAVSPSGRWVSVGDHRGGVRVWDLDGDTPLERRLPYHKSHRGRVLDMEFSPDSTTLVTVGGDGVLRWDIPGAAKTPFDFYNLLGVKRFEGWGERIYSVAFRPGSNRRVAVGGAKTVWLADLSRPNALAQPIESTHPFNQNGMSMTAAADLSLIATMGKGDKVSLWQWDGNRYQERPSPGDDRDLDRIALSPDGRTLVGLACTGRLVIHPLIQEAGSPNEPHKPLAPPSSQKSKDCAIAFAPDGQSFATGIGGSLQLWSRTGSGTWQTRGANVVSGNVLALAFSPTGDRLACGGHLDHILLWEVAKGRLQSTRHESAGVLREPVQALAFDPDGQFLVSGADDAIATAWQIPDLDKVSQSSVHERRLTALGFGRRAGATVLISADAEGQLVLCVKGVDDKQCARLVRLGGQEIRDFATNADLSRLIVADSGLWVWDLRRQTMLDTVRRLSQ